MSVEDIIRESIETKTAVLERPEEIEKIQQVSETILRSLRDGGKVILFGNGGSAADAQHIAAELAGRFKLDRSPLPALALTTNTSSLTAIANDYGYESVFERQVNGLTSPGDVVIGISTSGTSENVIRGVRAANELDVQTVGFTGQEGGSLADQTDYCLRVPSTDTARIQEVHIMYGHIISELVEAELFG